MERHTDDEGARGSNPEAEVAFQAERAAAMGDVRATSADVVARYSESRRWRSVPLEGMFHALGDLRGRRLLDFGCGEGQLTTIFAALGAEVMGVDVSPELIGIARRRAELDGVTGSVELRTGDILEMEGLEETFDGLACNAVLHHVPLDTVYPALLRMVKKDGLVVIREPIAYSGGLQRIRDRVPVAKDVSPEERQLGREEIRFLAAQLHDVEERHYYLTARLARLFRFRAAGGGVHPLTMKIAFAFGLLDRVLLTLFPSLSRFAGVIVLRGRIPTR